MSNTRIEDWKWMKHICDARGSIFLDLFVLHLGKICQDFFFCSIWVNFSRTLCCNWVKAGGEKAFRKWTLVVLIERERGVEIQIHFSKVSMEPVILYVHISYQQEERIISTKAPICDSLKIIWSGRGSICSESKTGPFTHLMVSQTASFMFFF